MSYTALYRKWRPKTFDDVRGQDHIVQTLKNQIKAQRIGHAYLFCGTRGTGKTSVAKILAKTVNCENPLDGNPCNTCSMCQAINSQTLMNVIEIDAASNNGVDNIRDIRDEVQYSPTEGKYKVYIIDEVHMLSIGAFNALLKTLEEPPSYVIFILATTEAHKIPVTILSRCQRYDFKRISIDTIAKQLLDLMGKEQISVDEKAIRYIAKVADGSMRDALSILDQCIAFYLGQQLTLDKALEVLGAVDTQIFSELLSSIIKQSVEECIIKLEELVMQGRELGQFINDFTWYLRNLLLVKTSDDVEDILDVSEDNIVDLQQQSEKISINALMRYIRIFSELSNQVKYATQKRIIIEVALIKMCRPTMEESLDSIIDRLSLIENKIKDGVMVSATQVKEPVPKPKEETIKIRPKALPEDIKLVVKNWVNIIMETSGVMKQLIKRASLDLGVDNTLILVFSDELAKEYFDREESKSDLENIINSKLGKEIRIETRLIAQNTDSQDNGFIDLQKLINIDITYEE